MEKVKIPITKRIFDIIIAVVAIFLFSPLILLILLAMLIENFLISSSRGKFLYSETRISAGEPFTIYKFRIFKNRAIKIFGEDNIIHTKQVEEDKENLTYVGRFLKRIYFDEIPQLFNVLKGDMSLVGPRPTNIENYEKSLRVGDLSKFLIKAGITGYFQSHKGLKMYNSQEETDMEYVEFCMKNPGWKIVLYDLKIILITIKTILRAEGI